MTKSYTCENARKDIEAFFAKETQETERHHALWRIMKHMMHEFSIEIRHISCKKCYRYYQKKKRKLYRGKK
jgi:protein-arginine kinase activator protein McsA